MTMVPPFPRDSAQSPLEPGDRFEITGIGSDDRLLLPRVLGTNGFALQRLDDSNGNPLEVAPDPAHQAVIVSGLGRSLPKDAGTLWLEYQAPGRFRLIVEPRPPGTAEGELSTE